MRAILVDDEGLALHYLERQLTNIGGIEIAGTYRSAGEALREVDRLNPDVAFLDIDMPEISGIEAAELLYARKPGIAVVFVTAYEHYAVKAFELSALDYVLKPINEQRLSRTLERLKSRAEVRAPAREPEPVVATVGCFRRLTIEYGQSEPIAWRTARAQELFAYLTYKRNAPVRKDVLLELLWPDVDYKKAYTQLYTTVYQIRKTLEAAGLTIRLNNSGNDYFLDLGINRCDVQEWENARPKLPPMSPETADKHLEWLQAYAGDFLAEHEYLWAENERKRLRDLWYKHALELGDMWTRCGFRKEALELYEYMEQTYPYAEEVYFLTMKLHAENRELGSAKAKYDQLCVMLREEYSLEPSPAVRQWAQTLFRQTQ
ncbi:response regulator [Paenibacillaceae bacterium WGS1546]|uniref:response regulator n=1 Tax=Cohnella sp. WGS1546 TaxID=3366810 RepID=UPI00372D43D5